ncbi:EPIDERMAL PATTERNING FACTOR-like protein 1 [Gastrolobium bilobum]|uniref:EPIDERMAL PATTERNING FACTOR-like protein 1 n=1 Tax=Gastrolobium bilobum TaxID=150636 RepID=UPI002AB2BAC1|nr:EPIDERMAL PATTERNING FACTOR-like protein 1 [Gastrolobium bilobum]
MASPNSYQYSSSTTTTTLLIIVLLHHLLCLVSSFNQPQPAISPRELLFEEKNRLGSIPPSCHNKCNECHPCMAVQVPTLPSHDPVQPDLTKTVVTESLFNPSSQGNRYSNYKPLGWKCHCGDHFFNP